MVQFEPWELVANVQKTAQSSLLHKCNAVELGYYEDEFIDKFIQPKPQITITSLVYTIRVKGIRIVLDKFIQSFPNQTVQFVNLGSGFDTISFYALKKYPNVICFDTDFDDQMKTKSKIIYENDCFKQLLPDLKLENEFISSNRYKIVPFDLSNINDFNNLINAGLSSKYPTFYLAEAVFMYIDPNIVDPVNCDDKFGEMTIQTFKEYNLRILGVTLYNTLQQHNNRYSELGWDDVLSTNMNIIWLLFDQEEKKRIQNLESFNEVEELGIICGHLMLGIATKNFNQPWEFLDFLRQKIKHKDNKINVNNINTYSSEIRESFQSYNSKNSFNKLLNYCRLYFQLFILLLIVYTYFPQE
ncbi:leucine carboxylmethyl transferase, putative [Theileria annulata]|uniref:[phosphatase 2A protein]-leucine-carboxy methyltransferase n=1 Tax=Theileria annulata TaxID=5874 RepID=Q4UAG9_THEAN|nr:leucine carboxylmethyl transferase, putative [Theileria annulata]CAI76182.1 leucine carboxylmethyl transferase, putative [Theileria annulata]|eukprot:XP_952807.1 leucine carboxylmethyl transferase, putative [Theileria annulata]